MTTKKNCKFCKKKAQLVKVCSYNNLNHIGLFYVCKKCRVISQPKIIKNLYQNQNSSNYNLSKNLFYYLKQITLIYFIFKLKKFFISKKDILDYGCGSGELSIALSFIFKDKNIFTSDVFKIDKKFIPKVKKHYLINRGDLENKKFDVILMRHVLEHIFDLNNFITKIKKNFKNKNSLLILEVPNMDSLWRKIMKRRWPGYFYPFHYFVFSSIFLRNFLSKNGLKIIDVQHLEPPIVGSFLLTFGINKSLCKFLSLIFYPLQLIISKISFSSEAILLVVKQK